MCKHFDREACRKTIVEQFIIYRRRVQLFWVSVQVSVNGRRREKPSESTVKIELDPEKIELRKIWSLSRLLYLTLETYWDEKRFVLTKQKKINQSTIDRCKSMRMTSWADVWWICSYSFALLLGFLAYTITAMHANFVLCLLSSSSSASSNPPSHHHSSRTCLQSCGLCLRRFFRRFCFCLVLCVWSLSFTATIPLLYTIDSNEKAPKPVYCPGTTQISYLEEWFDRNRLVQSVIFNLIPLLVTFFLSMIALLKLFYDSLLYIYVRCKMSQCSPCRRKARHPQGNSTLPNSISMLSSLGIISNSHQPSGFAAVPTTDTSTPTSDLTICSNPMHVQSCGQWCSTSFLRFLLVLSCCLLACIYPIAMRFYLVYFSVLIPLIFAVLNYSLGNLVLPTQTSATDLMAAEINDQQQQQQQQQPLLTTVLPVLPPPPVVVSPPPLPPPPPPPPLPTFVHTPQRPTTMNWASSNNRQMSGKREENYSYEQYELQSSSVNPIVSDSDLFDDRDPYTFSDVTSSQSSIIPVPNPPTRSTLTGKQKYFSNNLYENYHRNVFMP